MRTPEQLASDVAVALARPAPDGPELRSVVDEVPDAWSLGDEAGHWIIVRALTGPTPAFVGDGATLSDTALIEVDLWETEATASADRYAAIVATLDRRKLPEHSYAGRLQSFPAVPEPTDPAVVRHVATFRYEVRR